MTKRLVGALCLAMACGATVHAQVGLSKRASSSAGGSLPAGAIVLTSSSSCPAGTTEANEFAGRMLLATTAGAGDAGSTGGADNITPGGSVSAPTFTGSALAGHAHDAGTLAIGTTSAGTPAGTVAWPAAVPTFTGAPLASHAHGVGAIDNAAVSGGTPGGTISAPVFTGNAITQVINHTHPLATGTGTTGNFAQVIGTVDTSSGGTGGTPTQTALGTLSGNPAGGVSSITPSGSVSAPTFTGNALATHDHTLTGSSESVSAGTPAGSNAWPGSVPTFSGSALSAHGHTISGAAASVSAGTPAGTVSTPSFTGNAFDNRSAFVRVIPCRVN